MMSMSLPFDDISLSFTSPLWVWQGKGAWYFLTLPEAAAHEVQFFASDHKARPRRGFGSLRVRVTVLEGDEEGDAHSWQTSIFPDKARGSYLLPIKAAIRARHHLQEGDNVSVRLQLID